MRALNSLSVIGSPLMRMTIFSFETEEEPTAIENACDGVAGRSGRIADSPKQTPAMMRMTAIAIRRSLTFYSFPNQLTTHASTTILRACEKFHGFDREDSHDLPSTS